MYGGKGTCPCEAMSAYGSLLSLNLYSGPVTCGHRPSSVAVKPPSICSTAPAAGFLLTFICAATSWPESASGDSTRSINNSSRPPLAFCPYSRALTTLVSLNTSTSPGSSRLGKSVNRRSTKAVVRASSKREPLRSKGGCWAMSSGGRTKSKSLRVKAVVMRAQLSHATRCRRPTQRRKASSGGG